nr:hypothetical protein [Tanacetum cinerariifolium]
MIGDWKNKSFSFARRLQLCKSVISSMQVYWASILVIHMGIVSDIQQLIRGFLWCNGEYKRGKAKVAWDDICLPKKEGGLGLRSLEGRDEKKRLDHLKQDLSKLLVNYLGFPLISSRLLNRDCKVLVEKSRNMIGDWKNKSFSFVRRLQLCKSVISSMQVYWASILVIHMGIVSDIQQLIRGFLWCNGEYKRGKAKVAWDDICLPKKEGGLGLRSLEQMRVMDRESCYNLENIFLSPRDITREGYSIHTCVADLIVNDNWNWPLSWLAKAPNLGLVPTPTLIASRQDCMKWHDTNGTMTDFMVKCAWEVLRPRGNEVPWFHTVWFSHAIPRHAFQLWLIMRRNLKTQDKLRRWDVDPATDLTQVRCSLCGTQADSHKHLFFECSYSSKVWSLLHWLVGMDVVPPVLENIIVWFQPLANKRTVQNIVGKILFAAATYFIWVERNNRLFKRTRRSPKELRDAIVVTVRLKLVQK